MQVNEMIMFNFTGNENVNDFTDVFFSFIFAAEDEGVHQPYEIQFRHFFIAIIFLLMILKFLSIISRIMYDFDGECLTVDFADQLIGFVVYIGNHVYDAWFVMFFDCGIFRTVKHFNLVGF